MSRFATPNRNRIPTLAISPSIPSQKDPGYRYGRGVNLPGPSLKGRHFIDVKFDGVVRKSPTSIRNKTINQGTPDNPLSIVEHVSPMSTVKPFERPEKEDRTMRRKSPTPTSRQTTPLRINREKFSVNAEVVSVASESKRSKSALSTKSSPSLANKSGWFVDNAENKSTTSKLSVSRSVSPTISSKYSIGTNNMNNLNMSSLYQSLSENSPSKHGVNKLQISQSSFKSVRKAQIRDSIMKFLQNDDSLPSALIELTSSANINSNNSSINAAENIKETKTQNRLLKMTDQLRMAIIQEIQEFNQSDPSTLFFPSEHMYHKVIAETRTEIHQIYADWCRKYMNSIVNQVDKSYHHWLDAQQQRFQTQSHLKSQLQEKTDLIKKKENMKVELIRVKRQAIKLNLDIANLLAKFPSSWFDGENNMFDIETSAFLSPEIYRPNGNNEGLGQSGQSDRSNDLHRANHDEFHNLDEWQQDFIEHSNYYGNHYDNEYFENEEDLPPPPPPPLEDIFMYMVPETNEAFTALLPDTPNNLRSQTKPDNQSRFTVNFDVIRKLSEK